MQETRATSDGFVKLEVLSRRYHLHWPGVVFIITTVLLALGAIQTQNNVLYIGFGLAVGALLFSGIASGAMLMGVRLEREVEHATGVDLPLQVRYRVRNSNRIFPAFALVVEEVAKVRKRTPATWSEHIRGSLLGVCVANLRAGDSIIMTGEAKAASRGAATFDTVRVWTTFPFGITRKSVLFGLPEGMTQRTLVRPRVTALRRAAVEHLLSRDQAQGASRPRRGGREEFLGIRQYVPQDGQNSIAWKASARSLLASDQLMVREHASLSGRKVWLEIDPTVADVDKAAEFAASMLFAIIASGSAAGLRLPGATYPPVLSVRLTGAMLDGLALLDAKVLAQELSAAKGSGARVRIGGFGGLPLTDFESLARKAEGAA